MNRTIFVTGTDTGVGKTVVTSLLLRHLRRSGISALAMKPFATGDRCDIQLLQAGQEGLLPDDLINPFFFPLPVAPAVAAQKAGRRVTSSQVLAAIRQMRKRCDVLLVEGAGGLLAPLGAGYYTAENVIAALRCDVVVVARNQLGTLNHTALVIRVLRKIRGIGKIRLVLNQNGVADESVESNAAVLGRWLKPLSISEIPKLLGISEDFESALASQKKLKKVLATILH